MRTEPMLPSLGGRPAPAAATGIRKLHNRLRANGRARMCVWEGNVDR